MGLNEAISMKMRKLIMTTVSADSLMDLDDVRMFQTLNFTQEKLQVWFPTFYMWKEHNGLKNC